MYESVQGKVHALFVFVFHYLSQWAKALLIKAVVSPFYVSGKHIVLPIDMFCLRGSCIQKRKKNEERTQEEKTQKFFPFSITIYFFISTTHSFSHHM